MAVLDLQMRPIYSWKNAGQPVPGRWNDKTVVRFDGFNNGIHLGRLYDKVTFEWLIKVNIQLGLHGTDMFLIIVPINEYVGIA